MIQFKIHENLCEIIREKLCCIKSIGRANDGNDVFARWLDFMVQYPGRDSISTKKKIMILAVSEVLYKDFRCLI